MQQLRTDNRRLTAYHCAFISVRTIATLLLAVIVSYSIQVQAAWVNHDTAIMGSNIHIEFWAEEHGQQHLQHAIKLLKQVDAQMSPYKPSSEVSAINLQAANTAVSVSADLIRLIHKAQWFSKLSGGAFDISFASIGKDYNYRQQQRPNALTLSNHLSAVNYQSIVLDLQANTVSFKHPQTQIDLGGIAKGYAVDKVAAYFISVGIEHALITAGGDSRILGDKRGKPWLVGIKNPRNPKQKSLIIPLENTALSTSGDYERFFIEDGTRHHHILNPQTGYSPEGSIQSVSILADDSTSADALSTTVFVMGIEKGLALINKLDGIDAIIIAAGGHFHYSEGLQQVR